MLSVTSPACPCPPAQGSPCPAGGPGPRSLPGGQTCQPSQGPCPLYWVCPGAVGSPTPWLGQQDRLWCGIQPCYPQGTPTAPHIPGPGSQQPLAAPWHEPWKTIQAKKMLKKETPQTPQKTYLIFSTSTHFNFSELQLQVQKTICMHFIFTHAFIDLQPYHDTSEC